MSELKSNIADDATKLLDNGWNVVLFKNGLGSYSGIATKSMPPERVIDGGVITDDFTPSRVLYRLTEKTITGRIVDSKSIPTAALESGSYAEEMAIRTGLEAIRASRHDVELSPEGAKNMRAILEAGSYTKLIEAAKAALWFVRQYSHITHNTDEAEDAAKTADALAAAVDGVGGA